MIMLSSVKTARFHMSFEQNKDFIKIKVFPRKRDSDEVREYFGIDFTKRKVDSGKDCDDCDEIREYFGLASCQECVRKLRGEKNPGFVPFIGRKVIAVSGIIGAGKTTLCDILKERFENDGYKVCFIQEPVEKWKESGLLERFYNDMKGYAYKFQTQAFVDRITACKLAYKEHGDNCIYILERSIFCDNIFVEKLYEDGFLDDLEYSMYKSWWKFWSETMPFAPDVFLYLNPPTKVCMERIKKRNRKGEENITQEYQQQLSRHHDKFYGGEVVDISQCCDNPNPVPIVSIDTNEDFSSNENLQKDIYDKIWVIMRSL